MVECSSRRMASPDSSTIGGECDDDDDDHDDHDDDDNDDDDDGDDDLWRAMVGENAIAMTMTGGAVGGMGGGGGWIVRDDDDKYDDIRPCRDGSIGRLRNLDAHVCLLATIARRVARRSPSSDRRLVITFSRERVHREG